MNRIISEELYTEIMTALTAHNRTPIAVRLRSAPLATALDLRSVPGVDILYFLSTLHRFLEKELTSDEVSEALVLNVKLIDKHLMALQPTSGQMGEAFEAGWNAAYKNRDEAGPILSRAKERYLAETLRTQPQAPVVEVLSLTMQELESAWDIGVGLDSDHKWPGYKRTLILNQIHALLQSKGSKP